MIKGAKDSRIKKIINHYHDWHISVTGEPCVIAWGKVGKQVKGLLEIYPEDRIIELINMFYKIKDDSFINENGRDFGIFYSMINKLVARQKKYQKAMPVRAEILDYELTKEEAERAEKARIEALNKIRSL
jgi:hypothetical protein